MGSAQSSEKRSLKFLDHDSEELPYAEFAARWEQRTYPKTGEDDWPASPIVDPSQNDVELQKCWTELYMGSMHASQYASTEAKS